jgi:hypothetical protein
MNYLLATIAITSRFAAIGGARIFAFRMASHGDAWWLGAPLQYRDESRHGTQECVRHDCGYIVILARALRLVRTGEVGAQQ